MALPDCIEIPGGSFVIGCTEGDKFGNAHELPNREIHIAPFRLGRAPVTEAEFAAFRPEHGPSSDLPVVQVSWQDASDYCAWLRDQTGQPCRLPSEAEWEYACRAGSTTPFPSGQHLPPEEANYLYDEGGNRIGPGKRLPSGWALSNAFGLQDMLGNVCEWVTDDWVPTYEHLDVHGAPQTSDSLAKVIRGGGWDYLPRLLRCSSRDFAQPDTRRDNLGFRIALDLL